MFLAEVALGRITPFTKANYNAKEFLGDTSHASWGKGLYQPTKAWYNDDVMICPNKLEESVRHSLDYNEFVVYSTAQISLKYLVKVSRVSAYSFTVLGIDERLLVSKNSRYKGVIQLKDYVAVDLAPENPRKRPHKRAANTTGQPPTKRGRKPRQVNTQQPTLLNAQSVPHFFNLLTNNSNAVANLIQSATNPSNIVPNAPSNTLPSTSTNAPSNALPTASQPFQQFIPVFSSNYIYVPSTNLSMPQQTRPQQLVQQWQTTYNNNHLMTQNLTNQISSMPSTFNIQNNNNYLMNQIPSNQIPLMLPAFNIQNNLMTQISANQPVNNYASQTNNASNYSTNLLTLFTSTIPPVQSTTTNVVQNPVQPPLNGTLQNPIVLEDDPQPQIALWTSSNQNNQSNQNTSLTSNVPIQNTSSISNAPIQKTSITWNMPIQNNLTTTLPQQSLNQGTSQNPIVLEDEPMDLPSLLPIANNQINVNQQKSDDDILFDINDFFITKIVPPTNPTVVTQKNQQNLTNTTTVFNHSLGKTLVVETNPNVQNDVINNNLINDDHDLMITKIIPPTNPNYVTQNNQQYSTNNPTINVQSDVINNTLINDENDLMITKIIPPTNPKIGSQNNPIQIDDDDENLPFNAQQDISSSILTTSFSSQLHLNSFQPAEVL